MFISYRRFGAELRDRKGRITAHKHIREHLCFTNRRGNRKTRWIETRQSINNAARFGWKTLSEFVLEIAQFIQGNRTKVDLYLLGGLREFEDNNDTMITRKRTSLHAKKRRLKWLFIYIVYHHSKLTYALIRELS